MDSWIASSPCIRPLQLGLSYSVKVLWVVTVNTRKTQCCLCWVQKNSKTPNPRVLTWFSWLLSYQRNYVLINSLGAQLRMRIQPMCIQLVQVVSLMNLLIKQHSTSTQWNSLRIVHLPWDIKYFMLISRSISNQFSYSLIYKNYCTIRICWITLSIRKQLPQHASKMQGNMGNSFNCF